MTLVETQDSGGRPHLGELKLRRFRAGEIHGPAGEEISRHTAECGSCRSKLRLLQEEERQFEREIPFERFAGGVERALRVPRPKPRRVFWAMGSGLGLAAAAAAVLLLARPSADGDRELVRRANRIKGAPVTALARIAGAAGEAQRSLVPDAVTALKRGDRIRLGYTAGSPLHLVALSMDDAGGVTVLYPEHGTTSLSVGPTRSTTYLPDSLELTGSGRERVFLFMAEQPINLESATQVVQAAHGQARGDLGVLRLPAFEGRSDVQQFSWLFKKP